MSWSRLKNGTSEGEGPRALYCAAHAQSSLSSPALGWTHAHAGFPAQPHSPHPHRSLTLPLLTCLPHLRATRSKLPGMRLLFSEKHNLVVWKPQTDPESCRAGCCPGTASLLSVRASTLVSSSQGLVCLLLLRHCALRLLRPP